MNLKFLILVMGMIVDETASAKFSTECSFVTYVQIIVIFIFIYQDACSFIKAEGPGQV